MLSEKSESILRATLPVVAENIQQIAERFYQHMFAEHPELLDGTFNRGNQVDGSPSSPPRPGPRPGRTVTSPPAPGRSGSLALRVRARGTRGPAVSIVLPNDRPVGAPGQRRDLNRAATPSREPPVGPLRPRSRGTDEGHLPVLQV